MKLGRTLILTPRKKEVTADIIGYDFETNNITAQVNGKKAIMPMEDISIYQRQNSDFESILGSNVKCTIIDYDKTSKTFEISRKATMEKDMKKYNKGDVVLATVTSASDRALYLEFGEGLSGIMYLNELTSSKVKRPLDIYSVGDTIRCRIIQKDENGLFKLSRISLYKHVNLNMKKGDKIRCKVTKKLDDNSGYFVEVINNPLYSGILDVEPRESYKLGENVTLRIVGVKNKHLKLRAC